MKTTSAFLVLAAIFLSGCGLSLPSDRQDQTNKRLDQVHQDLQRMEHTLQRMEHALQLIDRDLQKGAP